MYNIKNKPFEKTKKPFGRLWNLVNNNVSKLAHQLYQMFHTQGEFNQGRIYQSEKVAQEKSDLTFHPQVGFGRQMKEETA